MGWFGDQIIFGQKPRKSGCICLLVLYALAIIVVLEI